MIHKITLTNYRRHTDLTVEFTAGLNAIRASVEAGKTTVLEAIAYAFFGAKALGVSLDDVVTYGVPVGKLKVELDFEHLGVQYHIYRGKSGAEVTFGQQRITGQTETSKFIEQLLGANADMAGKLMIASQRELRGALDEGPTAAARMIEKLANFDLLDEIKDLIQERLPYGSVDADNARIELARQQATAEIDTEALEQLQADEAAQQIVVAGAATALTTAKAAVDSLDVELARDILGQQSKLATEVTVRHSKIKAVELDLEEALPTAPAPAEIERLRAAVVAEKNVASALAVKAELMRLPASNQWDTDLASLEAEIEKTQQAASQGQLANLRSTLRDSERQEADETSAHQLKRQALVSRLITETSCSLCGKDLKDVPEVVRVNAELNDDVTALDLGWARRKEILAKDVTAARVALTAEETAVAGAARYLKDLQAVMADHAKCELLYARAGENVSLDRRHVPASWKWIGPEAGADSAPALRAAEQQAAAVVAATARREEQQKQLTALQAEQADSAKALDALPIKDAQETLDLLDERRPLVTAAEETLRAAERTLQDTTASLKLAVGLKAQAEQQRALAKTVLAGAEAERDEKLANVALVKKVAAARPVITDKLWNMVLAAVSRYFSDMRGTPSTITRGDGGFRCGIEPVENLSGSTKDILGLAIRAALTRTFLPMVPFLLLDEPAAACDDARETAMLGLLTTLGFDQIILVTHSELADASADNLITL